MRTNNFSVHPVLNGFTLYIIHKTVHFVLNKGSILGCYNDEFSSLYLPSCYPLPRNRVIGNTEQKLMEPLVTVKSGVWKSRVFISRILLGCFLQEITR